MVHPRVNEALEAIEAALLDGDARLATTLGGRRELTVARLWRGQVLVDWEPDPQGGDCLLRVDLLRRLLDLHPKITFSSKTPVSTRTVTLEAPGRMVAALSDEHAALVRRLGGARRVVLTIHLRFNVGASNVYAGGEETYA